ncbi:unnamed protein product [Adineta steineri]|uniref:Uncharacterized protein n=1 Tax=Adineta steineri TaxID=433720 RepID=A0A814BP25_9BILA|nr:unnamed protein product [Adineta steineri]CAF0929201.1 unnamed protein product [Adineta steineri]
MVLIYRVAVMPPKKRRSKKGSSTQKKVPSTRKDKSVVANDGLDVKLMKESVDHDENSDSIVAEVLRNLIDNVEKENHHMLVLINSNVAEQDVMKGQKRFLDQNDDKGENESKKVKYVKYDEFNVLENKFIQMESRVVKLEIERDGHKGDLNTPNLKLDQLEKE